MSKYKVQLFLLLVVLLGFCSCNRSGDNVKTVINEVLTNNVSNFQDDYGDHNAWIEIFNKSYGSVDIAGYRLKVSSCPGDTITYYIPKGDVLTVIKPRQHALFWADGNPRRGTFHTTCVVDTMRSNWIGLCDGGGKLIDEVVVPVLEKDLSYARVSDASTEWEVKGVDEDSYVTPSTNNLTIDRNEKVEKFAERDESGVGMSITAMLVVFMGLLLLFVLFRSVGKLSVSIGHRIIEKSQHKQFVEKLRRNKEEMERKILNKEVKEEVCNDEVYAAIAMALFEATGVEHDKEEHVLTIHHTHSPWSEKWTALRVIPQRK